MHEIKLFFGARLFWLVVGPLKFGYCLFEKLPHLGDVAESKRQWFGQPTSQTADHVGVVELGRRFDAVEALNSNIKYKFNFFFSKTTT